MDFGIFHLLLLPFWPRSAVLLEKKNDAVLLRFTGKTGHKERVFDSFEVFQIDSCVLISVYSLGSTDIQHGSSGF